MDALRIPPINYWIIMLPGCSRGLTILNNSVVSESNDFNGISNLSRYDEYTDDNGHIRTLVSVLLKSTICSECNIKVNLSGTIFNVIKDLETYYYSELLHHEEPVQKIYVIDGNHGPIIIRDTPPENVGQYNSVFIMSCGRLLMSNTDLLSIEQITDHFIKEYIKLLFPQMTAEYLDIYWSRDKTLSFIESLL